MNSVDLETTRGAPSLQLKKVQKAEEVRSDVLLKHALRGSTIKQ